MTEICDKCQFKSISQTGLRNHMAFVHRDTEVNILGETVTVNKLDPKQNILGERPTWNGMILHDPTRNKNRKQKSKIWMYGGCEENADTTINTDSITCGKCGWTGKYVNSTSRFLDHLRNVHKIDTS